jgi:hypothetical protein
MKSFDWKGRRIEALNGRMKIRTSLLRSVLFIGVTAMSSCGESTGNFFDSPDAAQGGSAGRGGSTGAGGSGHAGESTTGATGGSSTSTSAGGAGTSGGNAGRGSGGSAGAAGGTGGVGTGGRGGGGGAGRGGGGSGGRGGGGAAGSGGNPACGDPFEVHGGTPCPTAGLRCVDACGETCSCAGADRSWSCPDVMTCGVCPNSLPPPGTKCLGFKQPGTTCQVQGKTCFCNSVPNGTTEWQCFDCPSTRPVSGSACSPVGLNCPFGTTCSCYPDGSPTGGIWGCNNTPGTCPSDAPTPDSACDAVGVVCNFLGQFTGTCICSTQHMWKCSGG